MEKIFETKYVVVTDDVSSLLCLCFYAALRDRDDDHQILTSLHKYKYTNWAYFRFCHGTCYVNRVAVDNFSYLPTLAKSHDLSPNFAKRILILGLRHTNNMCPSVRLLCFLETIWRRSEASAIDPALRFRTLDCQSMNDGYGAWRWAMQRPGLPVKTPVVRVVLRFSLLSLPRVAVRVSISDDCTAPCWRCTATRFIGRRVGVKEQWAVNGGRILDIDRFMN